MKPQSDRAIKTEWSKIRAMFNMAQGMTDVVNFGIGEPDFETPEPVRAAAAKAIADGYTHYTANAGLPILRNAVAAKLGRVNEVVVDPDDSVIITAGGMGALSLALLALVNEGDEVLLPDPAWANYQGQITLCGGSTRRIPLRPDSGFTLTAADVVPHVSDKSKLLILNSPANPTGAVISPVELSAIAKLAHEHDFYIVSDEVYEHFVWESATHSSIASIPDAQDRTITVGSFSKSYAMTGWRVGYAAGPSAVISSMVKLQENIFACASSVSQMAAVAALREGEPFLASMISAYRDRRELALELLGGIAGISVRPPAGTFYIFADVSEIAGSSEQFSVELLKAERVVVVPGTAFGPGGEGFVRISFATNESQIREGMTRLSRFAGS